MGGHTRTFLGTRMPCDAASRLRFRSRSSTWHGRSWAADTTWFLPCSGHLAGWFLRALLRMYVCVCVVCVLCCFCVSERLESATLHLAGSRSRI